MTYPQSPSGKPFPKVPFLDSQTWLSKSKEFYDQGVIAQFKRAFKSYFCPSKNKKVGRRCIKFSSTQIQVSWYKCARCPILTQIQACWYKCARCPISTQIHVCWCKCPWCPILTQIQVCWYKCARCPISTQIHVCWYKCARSPILTQIQVCSISYFNPNTSVLILVCSMSYFNSNTSVLIQVCSISYFKIKVLFFCCPFFVKEDLDLLVRINKMANQQCWLPPWSFRINLKDISLGLYLTPEYL